MNEHNEGNLNPSLEQRLTQQDGLEKVHDNGDSNLETGIIKDRLEIAGYESASSSNKNPSSFRNYIVDTTAAWLYWTPTMTATETISGMESDEILKSRLLSLALQLFIGRLYGKFRQYWADLWDTNPESSTSRKLVVDTTALMCFQVPTYTIQLYLSGASLSEGIAALATGLTVGALSGRVYGYFQDKWRKLWGTRPTLDY